MALLLQLTKQSMANWHNCCTLIMLCCLCPSACGVPAAEGVWSTLFEESCPQLTSVSSTLHAGESAGVSGLCLIIAAFSAYC